MADAATRALRRNVRVPDYVVRRERLDEARKIYRTFRLFGSFEDDTCLLLKRVRILRLCGEKNHARKMLDVARRARCEFGKSRPLPE